MAGRPIKKGIDYFPLLVDFYNDARIQFINARFGLVGEAITIRLLCKIYREGYYIEFNDDYALLFTLSVGDKGLYGLVKDVVYELLKRGFFDRSIFERFGVLTSFEIQLNFIRASIERSEIEIIQNYWLIEIPNSTDKHKIIVYSMEDLINRQNNSINRTTNSQSKVNKSKYKDKNNRKDIIKNNKKNINELSEINIKNYIKKFDIESIEYKSSKYLSDEILKINPNAKVPKTDTELFKWCMHIDYMLRIDNIPANELEKVLVFAVKDNFWSSVILSTQKLRDKYDQIFMQVHKQNKNTGGSCNENEYGTVL